MPRRPHRRDLAESVGKKVARRMKARARANRSVWFGFGMFGLVGWAVAVPTVIGVAFGLWLDQHWTSRISWTLTFLFLGTLLGCLNAWYWVKRESRAHDDG